MSTTAETCPICLENLPTSPINQTTTACGHSFHTSCLMSSAAQTGFHCPCCRGAMTQTNEEKNKGVIIGRENVQSVSLQEFIDDINLNTQGYTFIKVLHREDRHQLIARLTEQNRLDCYKRRAMKLAMWVTCVKQMALNKNYTVYRVAYWGEVCGRTRLHNQPTNYMLPLWMFQKHNNPNMTQTWWECLRSACALEPRIRIFIDVDASEMKVLPDKFSQCKWHDTNYRLKDKYYN